MGLVKKLWERVRPIPTPGGKGAVDKHGPKFYVYDEDGRKHVTYRGEETYQMISAVVNRRKKR